MPPNGENQPKTRATQKKQKLIWVVFPRITFFSLNYILNFKHRSFCIFLVREHKCHSKKISKYPKKLAGLWNLDQMLLISPSECSIIFSQLHLFLLSLWLMRIFTWIDKWMPTSRHFISLLTSVNKHSAPIQQQISKDNKILQQASNSMLLSL